MGDPAGISPELTAKIAAFDEVHAVARLIVVGDRRVFDRGADIAGARPDIPNVSADDPYSLSLLILAISIRRQ